MLVLTRTITFHDEFELLDNWENFITTSLGDNEFQYFTIKYKRPENSFIHQGILFIQSTLAVSRLLRIEVINLKKN